VIIRAVKYFKLASVADWRTRALIGPPPLQLMEATEGEEGQTDYTTVYLPACPDVISYWENLGFGHLDEEWLLDCSATSTRSLSLATARTCTLNSLTQGRPSIRERPSQLPNLKVPSSDLTVNDTVEDTS
jgi:hypothetical protein